MLLSKDAAKKDVDKNQEWRQQIKPFQNTTIIKKRQVNACLFLFFFTKTKSWLLGLTQQPASYVETE